MFDFAKFFPHQVANGSKRGCWIDQFFPELCCQPPAGFARCFAEETSYELCCTEFLEQRRPRGAVPALAPLFQQEPPDPWAPRPPLPRVDLVVRSWHEDMGLIEMLLLSLAVFWPFARLRTRVVVVLDAEALETAAACTKVEQCCGSWAVCVGEPPPAWMESFRPKRPKAARVHWSTFWSDLYAPDADYVGVVDSDVIFHSFGAEALLFAPSPSSVAAAAASAGDGAAASAGGGSATPPPRSAIFDGSAAGSPAGLLPVIFGRWSSVFAFSSLAVQDEYPEANFMDSLPMVVRREDFAALRSHIQGRFARLSGQRNLSFDEAFALAEHQVNMFAAMTGWFLNYQGEFLCFQAAMGAYLWRFRRGGYHFSIRGGRARGLPAEATCPSLRVALHATDLKRAALWNSSVSYHREARGVMAAGLCAAGRSARGGLSVLDEARCREAVYQAEGLLMRGEDVGGDDGRWGAEESVHCGPRSVPRLLADFERLLVGTSGHHRAVLSTLRWAFRGNATGTYTYEFGAATVANSGVGVARLEMLRD